MVSAEITDQIWQDAEAEAKATVADAIAHLKDEGIAASGAVLNGSPFFAISDATKPGDLIVLTSHGRGGVRRWLLGSVAEKLVREGPVPVLLVPAVERAERVMG
jgi:nucleotide-binding universal stress UspA family protein